jgi:formylglycine-generating enzyme required for sulfatase activity
MQKRAEKRTQPAMYDANDRWETTAPVGTFSAGVSPFGALDMAGNVWEWTADWYADYSATGTNAQSAKSDKGRVFRGGGWATFSAFDVRAAHRAWEDPMLRDDLIGFRCARGD